jgi:hypothetical protein
MKSKRFSEEQIIGVLKEAEAGAKRPSTQWSFQHFVDTPLTPLSGNLEHLRAHATKMAVTARPIGRGGRAKRPRGSRRQREPRYRWA